MGIRNLVILVCALLLSSCAVKKQMSSAAPNDLLLNNKWQVIELSGKKINKEVNGKTPYLSFDIEDSHYAIITGCNTMSGAFTLAENNIKLKNGMSTMIYCDDMSVEDGFKSILMAIEKFKIEGTHLHLLDARNAVVAKLELIDSSANASVENTSWKLSFLADSPLGFNEMFGDNIPVLNFLADGQLSGNSSCNAFRASYTVQENVLKIADVMSTKMMCPTIKGEQLFLKTLEKVNKYSEAGKTLHLMIDDVVVMRFNKM